MGESERPFENPQEQTKSSVFQSEYQKITKLFESVEDAKRQLTEGLIHDAAFLAAENFSLRQSLSITGMIKSHPEHPDIQKPIPAAQQYRQNVNAYAVIIKTLNGILSKDKQEQDDEFDEFVKQHQGEKFETV